MTQNSEPHDAKFGAPGDEPHDAKFIRGTSSMNFASGTLRRYMKAKTASIVGEVRRSTRFRRGLEGGARGGGGRARPKIREPDAKFGAPGDEPHDAKFIRGTSSMNFASGTLRRYMKAKTASIVGEVRRSTRFRRGLEGGARGGGGRARPKIREPDAKFGAPGDEPHDAKFGAP